MDIAKLVFTKYQKVLDEIQKRIEEGDYSTALDLAKKEADETLCLACKNEFEELATRLSVATGFCPVTKDCTPIMKGVFEKIEDLRKLFSPEAL